MLSASETSHNGVFWYKDKILPINRDLFASASRLRFATGQAG
jgi:hypothetical protein